MKEFTPPSDFRPELIGAEKAAIGETFASVHNAHGYEATPEQPPYPSPDETVLFVGAQISVWKPRLDAIHSGEEPPSYCPQICIRLQNKDYFMTEDPVTFNSYFRAYGAIAPAYAFGEVVSMAEDFITQLGVDKERIVIKATPELASQFDTDREVILNSEPTTYYQWGYGEPELAGNGLTIAIKNIRKGGSFDIGNVIEIRKHEVPLVTEWGFGAETMLNAIHSDQLPIRYADMTEPLRVLLDEVSSIKYVDALATSLHVAQLGIRCSERGAGALLSEYLRGVAYIGARIERGIVDVEVDIMSLAELYQVPDEITAYIIDRVSYYMGRINYLYAAARHTSNISDSIGKQIGLPSTMAKAILTQVNNKE